MLLRSEWGACSANGLMFFGSLEAAVHSVDLLGCELAVGAHAQEEPWRTIAVAHSVNKASSTHWGLHREGVVQIGAGLGLVPR